MSGVTEWRTSYSEGYIIGAMGGPQGYEVEVVVYPRGGDVCARFVARKQFGLARTRAKLARRAAAWIAADADTRRKMQALEQAPADQRNRWWRDNG